MTSDCQITHQSFITFYLLLKSQMKVILAKFSPKKYMEKEKRKLITANEPFSISFYRKKLQSGKKIS
jgi:hypothetical protein